MLDIDIRRITSIEGDTLCYRKDDGSAGCVDLASCAAYKRASGCDEVSPSGLRSVGTRLFARPTAVYELYGPDGIRLYLDTGELTGIRRFLARFLNLDAKAFAQFYSVQERLNRNGWTTLDLS